MSEKLDFVVNEPKLCGPFETLALVCGVKQ